MKPSALLLFLVLPAILPAQKRYFDPVFPEVKVTYDVTYGVNSTIFQLNAGPAHTTPQILKIDVYEPSGDSAASRPLIVLVHGGFFSPPEFTGNCNGTKQDGEVMELAKRLARRGYVVAAMDYRLGWNPSASSELVRRFTFVNAVHRGVQDSRTCIRYFRKDHATANQFRVDPDKITLWGTEVGSYIALASATLNDMSDWDQIKFNIPNFGPMVQDSFNGNLDGTTIGIVSPSYNAITGYTIGDTLCTPNHLGFSSDFALTVDMGGELLELNWLQNDDAPIISFAAPEGLSPMLPNPCEVGPFGIWNIPPFDWPILTPVAGSCTIQAQQAQLGNNAIWENAGFDDPLTAHALTINNGIEGFYPFVGTTELNPWAFTTAPIPVGMMCDTNSVVAGAYLDTILAYFAPRACAVLGLSSDCQPILATQRPASADHRLRISPNPAHNETIVMEKEPIQLLELYDFNGKLLKRWTELNAQQFLIPRAHLPSGIYWLKAYLARSVEIGKVVWE